MSSYFVSLEFDRVWLLPNHSQPTLKRIDPARCDVTQILLGASRILQGVDGAHEHFRLVQKANLFGDG